MVSQPLRVLPVNPASWYSCPYGIFYLSMWLNLVICLRFLQKWGDVIFIIFKTRLQKDCVFILAFFPLWALVLGKPAAMFWIALWRSPWSKGLISLANSQGRSEALPIGMWVSLETYHPIIKPWGDCSLGWDLDGSLVRDLRQRHPAKPQPGFWSTEPVR